MGRWLPNLLCWLRIALGPAFALALSVGGVWPLAVVSAAALSDFLDGRIARRAGTASRGGLYLDVAADGIFLLTALAALALEGRVSWLMPLAVTVALGALARRWARQQPGRTPVRGMADRAGHAAGIGNYGLVMIAAAAPLGGVEPGFVVVLSLVMALFNLAPVFLRLAQRS